MEHLHLRCRLVSVEDVCEETIGRVCLNEVKQLRVDERIALVAKRSRLRTAGPDHRFQIDPNGVGTEFLFSVKVFGVVESVLFAHGLRNFFHLVLSPINAGLRGVANATGSQRNLFALVFFGFL